MRLTKKIKSNILEQLVYKIFTPQTEELNKQEIEVAILVYNTVYTKKEIDFMDKAPTGYFIERDWIKVYMGNSYSQLNLGKPFRFMGKHSSSGNTNYQCIGDNNNYIYTAYHKWLDGIEKIKLNRNNFKTETDVILNSVDTMDKLIKVWPDIETLVDLPKAEPQNKLIPNISKINNFILDNLPKEEKKEIVKITVKKKPKKTRAGS